VRTDVKDVGTRTELPALCDPCVESLYEYEGPDYGDLYEAQMGPPCGQCGAHDWDIQVRDQRGQIVCGGCDTPR
jgi:hypothetical protein